MEACMAAVCKKDTPDDSFRRVLLWDNGELKVSLYLWASGERELIGELSRRGLELLAPWAHLRKEVKRSIPSALAQYFEILAKEI